MRVTNTMMRNNSMLNMQKNKVAYNKYLTQYNTQKKIQRPSDDPTIAARALKYRTTLAEIDQYLTNIKDATSWMGATETCLKAVNTKLTDMIDYCTQAATGTYNEKDRADIVTQLKQFSKYIYEQNADADYAGRYLFTGYRTDVPLLRLQRILILILLINISMYMERRLTMREAVQRIMPIRHPSLQRRTVHFYLMIN